MDKKLIKAAFFDMDHTVLDSDCDLSWKFFLVAENLAPLSDKAKAQRFFELYHEGRTPVKDFVKFQLCEFVNRSITELRNLADRHFEKCVNDYIFSQARQEIDRFNRDGIPTILLTGTNRIIAEPIARELKITKLFATEPEIQNECFTGDISGPFLMKEAKMKSAADYCLENNINIDQIAFYADSITDLAMLEKVGYPVVINPGRELNKIALTNQWQIKQWTLKNKQSLFPGFNKKRIV